jgi:hypothetical protein
MQSTMKSLDAYMEIRLTATTNKAASVLQSSTGTPATTIHSILGLKPKNNYVEGTTDLVTTKNTRMIKNSLIFIDEASMVSKELFAHIKKYIIDGPNNKVVFIGDMYQLAPVNERNSVVFNRKKGIVYLTEIQRQVKNSPIIQAGALFRELLDKTSESAWPIIPLDSGKVVQKLDGQDFTDKIVKYFSVDHKANDLKILAYTNKRVIQLNKFVRNLTTNSDVYQPGEKLITNDPILDSRDGILFHSDYPFRVTRVEEGKTKDNIDCFFISVHTGNIFTMPKDFNETEQLKKHFANLKDWNNYFRIKREYVDLRPIHASTCHKAQGSTYEKVFIDLDNIGKNRNWREIARLVYVAISRAREKVYIYGDLPIRKWTT